MFSLNLLVSNIVLKHAIHVENLAGRNLVIVFLSCLVLSIVISPILIHICHGNLKMSIVPVMVVVAIGMFVIMIFAPLDGDGGIMPSSSSSNGYASNATYQNVMLHNNYKIKFQHHLYNHYKHLLNTSNSKQNIAKYGYKVESIKHHINNLKLYNQNHIYKAKIPSMSRILG